MHQKKKMNRRLKGALKLLGALAIIVLTGFILVQLWNNVFSGSDSLRRHPAIWPTVIGVIIVAIVCMILLSEGARELFTKANPHSPLEETSAFVFYGRLLKKQWDPSTSLYPEFEKSLEEYRNATAEPVDYTLKDLLQNQGTIYWAQNRHEPSYYCGIVLDYQPEALTAQLIAIMPNTKDDGELLAPLKLVRECATLDQLEAQDIILLNTSDQLSNPKAWYCVEQSVFDRSALSALKQSSRELNDYLEPIIAVLQVDPLQLDASISKFDRYSYLDVETALDSISGKIDTGELKKPLPFGFTLIGEAIMGWQFADEADYR